MPRSRNPTRTGSFIGERIHGIEVGYIGSGQTALFEWTPCIDCARPRWVRVIKNMAKNPRCHECNNGRLQKGNGGPRSPSWKGGRRLNDRGYIRIWVAPSDFFRMMADHMGYVLEHRLVMAQHLRRNLHRWELVHHKNRQKADNRLENLQLVSDERHQQITILEMRIAYLESRITLLESELVVLRSHLAAKETPYAAS